jgi:hypothetical protein
MPGKIGRDCRGMSSSLSGSIFSVGIIDPEFISSLKILAISSNIIKSDEKGKFTSE